MKNACFVQEKEQWRRADENFYFEVQWNTFGRVRAVYVGLNVVIERNESHFEKVSKEEYETYLLLKS